MAAGVEAGVGADGADDAVASDFGFFGGFDERVEGGVEIVAAEIEDAGDAGVAVEGRTSRTRVTGAAKR